MLAVTYDRKNRLILIALAVVFAWPVLHVAIGLLSAPRSGLFLPIGGQVEPDDDLLPAADPAFAPALHARYSIIIQQKTAGAEEFDFTLAAPAQARLTVPVLRGLACRIDAWLAHQPIPVHPVKSTMRLERADQPGPVEASASDCQMRGPATVPGG